MKRIVIFVILIVSILLLYGCGNGSFQNASTAQSNSSASTSGGKVIEVNISNYTFDPQTVTISKGDTVKWTNKDSMAHTATGKTFDSGKLEQGASFEFKFNDAGSYDYICSYHPNMKGTVTVK